MKKNKTSLKKRIFALVGAAVTLFSVMVIGVSANDTTFADYNDPNYIPFTPRYYNNPTFYRVQSADTGNSYYVPFADFSLSWTAVDTSDGETVDITLPDVTNLISNSHSQSAIVRTNIGAYFNVLGSNTFVDGVLDPKYVHNFSVSDGSFDTDYIAFYLRARDFWFYPRSNYDSDRVAGDIVRFAIAGGEDTTTYTAQCFIKWRFLESSIVYTSIGFIDVTANGNDIANSAINIDYYWLINNCTDDYLVSHYEGYSNLASPVFIDDFQLSVDVYQNQFDNYYLYYEVPCLKDVENELYINSLNATFAIGDGDVVVSNPDFNINMIFSAVSDILAMPIIGYISIGGILSAFFALAVVLAVLSLFRGST